jgi:hypothetical protein
LCAQVESLVVELDDIAVRQGEQEARRHQKLIEEVEELRAQLAFAKRDAGHESREGQFKLDKCMQQWTEGKSIYQNRGSY